MQDRGIKKSPAKVRAARVSDIPGILALVDDNRDKILPRSEEEIRRLRKSFLVVEVDGEVVGCGCLEVYSKKIAEIRTVAISEEHKGEGLGTLLVTTLIRKARRKKIPEILVVTSNRDFFEHLNFRSALNEKYALFWNDPKAKHRRER